MAPRYGGVPLGIGAPEVRCQAMMSAMLRHEFDFEAPHSAARLWAILHDYDRWTDWSTMVDRVDVLWPGDADHNGRLRRVFYRLPDGQTGSSLELVTEAVANQGHTYTMISRDGNDHVGHVRLEPLGPDRTVVHFDEEADLDPGVYASSTGTTRLIYGRRRTISPPTPTTAQTWPEGPRCPEPLRATAGNLRPQSAVSPR